MSRMTHVAITRLVLFISISAVTLSFTPKYPTPGNVCIKSVRINQRLRLGSVSSSARKVLTVDSVEAASTVLSKFDELYNFEFNAGKTTRENELNDLVEIRPALAPAVRLLAATAAAERNLDSTRGRCMLGICASSAEEGVATLKSWVTALELPRGLLHGMDKDGIPLDLSGGVYIKYNSGGVYTFEDIRKSGMGFDALWKPGDAMLETYDGIYRGVYFQVELQDDKFRQYLVPLDVLSVVE
jgi:hypothetical protein